MEKESYNDKVGDILWLWFPNFEDIRIECVVTEVDPDEHRACRFKAVHPDPAWGAIGFIQEGEDWVIVEWSRELGKIDALKQDCPN